MVSIKSSEMQNLHIEEKAYIAVFLAHHSKSTKILDKIVHNAMSLFDKYKLTEAVYSARSRPDIWPLISSSFLSLSLNTSDSGSSNNTRTFPPFLSNERMSSRCS